MREEDAALKRFACPPHARRHHLVPPISYFRAKPLHSYT